MNVVNMQKGFGYVLDDDFVNGGFVFYGIERFSGSGTGALCTSAPRTCTDRWARVRTLYQDGHFESCNSDPTRYDG
ncbi:hypothetical protein [Mumia sp. Pv 4-285]|uniref:hypothetical protein n=1 Tax=Mumia qirimensis TaxID=3234852 RepID=UPI00351D957B